MAEYWRCRFFGGFHDGEVVNVNRTLITLSGVFLFPIPVEVEWTPAVNDIVAEAYATETYRWDQTVNEAGERRMRWQP